MRAGTNVATNPPEEHAFVRAYQEAIASGADAIVSVHLSARMSQTCETARRAATRVSVPVHVADSGTTGMSLGYAALAAARVAGAGGSDRRVVDTLRRRLQGSAELIYVDTMEYLRRGGRVGAAQAFLGGALSIKPLLTLSEGQVTPLTRVFGAERALRKMLDLAIRKAGDKPVDVAVEHFGSPQRAESLLTALLPHLPAAAERTITDVSSTIGAHVGPGALGITISPA